MNNLLKEKSKFTYSLNVKTAQIHQDLRVKIKADHSGCTVDAMSLLVAYKTHFFMV